MPFKFKLTFSGLCIVVPATPFDDPQVVEDPGWVRVLLPRLLEPRRLSGERGVLDPHFPVLSFQQDNQREGLPVTFTSLSGAVQDLSHLLLAGFDVDIQVDGAPVTGPVGVSRERRDDSQDSLLWLVNMREMSAAHERLRPGLLDQPLSFENGGESGVACRVRLQGGRLSASGQSREECQIDGPAAAQAAFGRRRIASHVTWSIDDVQDNVTLRLRHFADGESKVVFQAPSNGGIRPEVEVHIQNREIDELVGLDRRFTAGRALADSEVFFGYAEQAAPVPVPFVVPLMAVGDPGSSVFHTAKCPPLVMLPGG